MYSKIVSFAKLMEYELQNNVEKGNWEEFKDISAIWNELNYHDAKLYEAYVSGDRDKIKKCIADCANILLFMANAYDLLTDVEHYEVTKQILFIQMDLSVSAEQALEIRKSNVIKALESDFHVLIVSSHIDMNIIQTYLEESNNNKSYLTKIQYEELSQFIKAYYNLK